MFNYLLPLILNLSIVAPTTSPTYDRYGVIAAFSIDAPIVAWGYRNIAGDYSDVGMSKSVFDPKTGGGYTIKYWAIQRGNVRFNQIAVTMDIPYFSIGYSRYFNGIPSSGAFITKDISGELFGGLRYIISNQATLITASDNQNPAPDALWYWSNFAHKTALEYGSGLFVVHANYEYLRQHEIRYHQIMMSISVKFRKHH